MLKSSGLALVCAVLSAACAQAQEKVQLKTVLQGLTNPAGAAVQPGTGAVYVSDSGAGRVLRLDSKNGGDATPAITDFTIDIYGKGPKYNIGPLGLLFLDEKTLVVGGGDRKDGEEVAYIFELPAKGALKAGDAKHKLGPIAPGEASKLGEGNFYGVAADRNGIYFTSNGDDTKGWVLKVPLEGGAPGKLTPFIATKVAVEVDAPVGIAISPKGQIAVGQMGEINVPTDSLLTFYDAKTGKLLSKATTGLYDIAGLAYSPKSGNLYAVDFAWMKTAEGGLYRLDVQDAGGKMTVRAAKIASLDKPTALAFAPDGSLYVTVIGTGDKGGKLIRVEGDL